MNSWFRLRSVQEDHHIANSCLLGSTHLIQTLQEVVRCTVDQALTIHRSYKLSEDRITPWVLELLLLPLVW